MGKDTAKNLVGQPVFKQVMKILPGAEFDLLVRQCGSDRSGLVYAHSTLVAQCNQSIIEKQESIFDRSGVDTDTSDKPFGFDVGSNRGQTCLY